jgi:drug/metabolite transporter (DMT)-like permease
VKYRFILLLTALIWGAAFVAQRVGGATMGPYAFNGIRFALGAVSVLPLVFWQRGSALLLPPPKWLSLPKACFLLGLALFAGTTFQQIGLEYTTAGKAGFITALYIIAVPLMGIFFHNPLRLFPVLGCVIGLIGLYLLAWHPDQAVNVGDLLELGGVGFWGFSILGISAFVKYYPSLLLAFGEILTCSVLSFACMFVTGETFTWEIIRQTAVPLLYGGIMSSGVAYTLQVIGQSHVAPVEASLILSCEMIFSALSGYLILGEVMSGREIWGCVIMGCGIFLAQIPSRIIWQGQTSTKE